MRAVQYTLIALTWFTILFDPAGAALGANFVILPVFFTTVAAFLGNFTWILGGMHAILVVIILIMLLNRGLIIEVIIDAIALQKENRLNPTVTAYNLCNKRGEAIFEKDTIEIVFFRAVSFTGGGVALGSGFEFLGTAWILAVVFALVYNSVGVELAKYAIKYGIDENE